VDLGTLLESAPHILEPEHVITIVWCSCTSLKWLTSIFWLAGTFEIGEFNFVESHWSKIQKKNKVIDAWCYWGHLLCLAYTGSRCYEHQARLLGRHSYILTSLLTILFQMLNWTRVLIWLTIIEHVRARTPAFGLIGIRMVSMVYGCKRGLEW